VKNIGALEAEIRQLFGKCVWTHKIQEKQADIYKSWSFWLELVRIIASAITTTGILALLLVDGIGLKIATAIVSLISTGINLYLKKYDLDSLEKAHKSSAVEWLCLREDYLSLLTDLACDRLTDEDLLEKRNSLRTCYKELCKKSPNTTGKAYDKASKSLKMNMDNIISDEEINAFLPIELRRGNK
jgi:hypothetical protein